MGNSNNWKHNFSIRGIKILDIGFIFICSAILSFLFSVGFNTVFTFDQSDYTNDKFGKFKLSLFLLFEFAILGICFYFIRVLVRMIPFPLDGVMGWNAPSDFSGYQHSKLKEYSSPYIIPLIMVLLLQDSLKKQLLFLIE